MERGISVYLMRNVNVPCNNAPYKLPKTDSDMVKSYEKISRHLAEGKSSGSFQDSKSMFEICGLKWQLKWEMACVT